MFGIVRQLHKVSLVVLVFLCSQLSFAQQKVSYSDVEKLLKSTIMKSAAWALDQDPITVTDSHSERSAGGLHDFYSEGDYWWPDPSDAAGPYIQRDGLTNPDNFTAHREAMIRLSQIVGSLASAYKITKDQKYADKAFEHLYAWFVNPETSMNPSLNYAQAIKGKVTGRGIGIIDTIHLMEVAQGLIVFEEAEEIDVVVVVGVKKWFEEYLVWLTTHEFGKDESSTKNNHSTCFYMQVASFASLTDNQDLIEMCRSEYKNRLLPNQMAEDGSFPLELARTKPYGYSIFNLDAMSTLAFILSDDQNDMMRYQAENGKSIAQGISFMYPYIADKSSWPFTEDVMYWDNWPVAQPALVFGAVTFNEKKWFDTWEKLDHHPEVTEVVRNLPIRNPLIWLED